jgi:hypothetical protein
MNKPRKLALLSAALVLFRHLSPAAEISVTVHAYDDQAGTTLLHVTEGIGEVTATRAEHDHDTEPGDPVYVGLDELDNPVYEYPNPVWTNCWTTYRVSLPDGWIGRGISFLVEGMPGYGWTSFRPLPGGSESYDLVESDFGGGGRPLPDPNAYLTQQGNRLLLGRWWSDSGRAVASLSTAAGPFSSCLLT